MSKNELRVIARIILIGIGLYVLLHTLINVLSGILTILTVGAAGVEKSAIITASTINVVLMLAAVYFLARIADRFSAKIVETEAVDDTQISWLAVAFRLVCITAGLLFLYWTILNLIPALFWYIKAKSGHEIMTKYQHLWPEIVKCVIMLGAGIYLACGAPGFVRWQVRRTLKQCSKAEEQRPPWY